MRKPGSSEDGSGQDGGSAGGFVNSLAHGGSSGVHTGSARRGWTLRVGKELVGKPVLRSE